MQKKYCLPLIFSLFIPLSVAHADILDLGTIVVTANRSPVEKFTANASINVVTREKIESQHFTNMQEALRDIPGVSISGYGNTGEVYSANSLILNGSDKIVVLIDGVRANINGSASTYGKMASAEISNMNNIERIEVLKSSSSTLWGADAAGGVINIITRKPVNGKTKSSIQWTTGSFGKEQYNFNHQGRQNNWYWNFFLQKKIAADFKDAWNRKIPEHLNAENNIITLGKEWKNQQLSVQYQIYRSHYLRPTNGWSSIADDYKENRFNTGQKDNTKLKITWQNMIHPHLTHTFSYYHYRHQADEKSWNQTKKSFLPYVYHFATKGFTDQFTYTGIPHHNIVTGFDYNQDRVVHYLTGSGYRNKKATSWAIYVHDDYTIKPHLLFSYGLRYHHDSNYQPQWIPESVISYSPNRRANMYLGYKKFFVSPYPTQLYGSSGNPNLNPESGSALEMGINYQIDPSTLIAFNTYYRDLKNSIIYDSGIKKYVNSGTEKARGFDVQLEKQWSKQLHSHISYVYTNIKPTDPSKNRNSDGRLPVSSWKIGITYQNNNWNTFLNIRGVIGKAGAGGKQAVINTSRAAAPYHTYWVVDLGTNYQISTNVSAFFKIKNVLNRLYTEQRYVLDPNNAWYSAPGRNMEIGVTYQF